MRRVESIMGTAVSVDVHEPFVAPEVLDDVFAQLDDIDARFSTYKPDSEISRLARGELAEGDCSLDVRHVLTACDHLAEVTNGAFDARRHRADGALDPSGFVKGWALEEAGWLIDSAGGRNYWINAGGDIVARGESAPGSPWRVGIRHPDHADRVAAVLAVSDRAVATSGSYERGDHITDPRSGAAPLTCAVSRSWVPASPSRTRMRLPSSSWACPACAGWTPIPSTRPSPSRPTTLGLDAGHGPLPGPRRLTWTRRGHARGTRPGHGRGTRRGHGRGTRRGTRRWARPGRATGARGVKPSAPFVRHGLFRPVTTSGSSPIRRSRVSRHPRCSCLRSMWCTLGGVADPP